jgi:hypothetical protein
MRGRNAVRICGCKPGSRPSIEWAQCASASTDMRVEEPLERRNLTSHALEDCVSHQMIVDMQQVDNASTLWQPTCAQEGGCLVEELRCRKSD